MNNMNKDELKEKVVDYASKVFFYCVKRCNNRMDAEDLSQTILLEIIGNIDKGAHIDNLDYYIWGVCKNQYNMYLRKTIKDRNSVEYMESIDEKDNSSSALDKLLEDEKIRRMNQAIKLLSKDYAEILYAYYVEDKTLKFIAEELSIPLGTAKWKLAEIRKKLKEYLEMEKLNGKKAYVPKSFQVTQSYSNELNYDPSDYINSLLVKNLLYHSYGNECSLEDYSIELGISIAYIEEFVNKLESKDFLIKRDNGKYLTNVAFIDKKERREILDFVRENISEYYNALVKFAENNLSYYKSLLDETNALDEHLLWTLLLLTMFSVEDEFRTEYTLRKDGFNWDLMLLETVDKLYSDEFFISANGTFSDYYGRRIGIMGFPANHWKEDGGASDVMSYNSALTGKFNLEILNNILNLNKKYSDLSESEKEIVNAYVKRGCFDLVGNEIKINIPVMSMENYKEFCEKVVNNAELISAYKELYNGVYMKVRSLIPNYLEKQTPFIIQSVTLTRALIITKAFNEGIIKDDKTREKFIYNGIIIK